MKNGERCKICRWKIYTKKGKEYMRVYVGGGVFQDRLHPCKRKPQYNKTLNATPAAAPSVEDGSRTK